MKNNWLAADWPAPDFIKAGVSLRHGGISQGAYDSFNLATHVGDELAVVKTNRNTLNQNLSLSNTPQWLEQVHSAHAVLLPNKEAIPKADAAYTLEKNIVCAVMTADCLPLLVTDNNGRCVAAIHAGWRGLCNGIIEETIKKLPVEAENLLVWLGPAISADVYEVGKEVYDAFTTNNHDAKQAFVAIRENHWLFDIYRMAKLRLNKIGVRKIYGGDHCTLRENELFFSYRRDDITGRMASMIWIDG